MVKIAVKEPVYIIIPVHNRQQITLTCLEHLQKNSDLQRYQVVVVDDGSTDGTTEVIRELYPEVIVLSGNGDLWWTGAIAKGMEYAHQHKAEYFIWLNDDCLPERDTLPQLVEFLKNHPDTIAAPTCYIQQGNSLIKQYNGAKGQKAYSANPGEIIEIDSLSGWCVGISAAVVRKIGVPDAKKFPHYCGDDMYILKATRSGFKAYLIGDIKTNLMGAVHEMSDFSKYFRPGLNTFQTLQALFFNKKSPYRLSTRFFYFRERYGMLTGTLFFLIKAALWFKEWTYLQLKYLN